MSNHGNNASGPGIRIEPPTEERIDPHQARATEPAPEAPNLVPLPNSQLLPLNLRLDRSNYIIWRSLVLAATQAYDLDGYILGLLSQPPQFLADSQPINDDDLILYILGGLGAEYEAVVINLTSRTEPLTLQEVQGSPSNRDLEAQIEETDLTTAIEVDVATGRYVNFVAVLVAQLSSVITGLTSLIPVPQMDRLPPPQMVIILKPLCLNPLLPQILLLLDKAKVVVGNGSSLPIHQDKTTKQVLLQGHLSEGLYKLQVTALNSQGVVPASVSFKPKALNHTTTSNPVHDKSKIGNVWHYRLGHHSQPVLNKVLSHVVPNVKCKPLDFWYSVNIKSYRCLHPSGVTRSVTFNEQEFPYTTLFPLIQSTVNNSPNNQQAFLIPGSNLTPGSNIIHPPTQNHTPPPPSPTIPPNGTSPQDRQPFVNTRSSSGSATPPVDNPLICPNINFHPMVTRSKLGIYKPKTFLAYSNDEKEPTSFKEAFANPKWNAAMNNEMTALKNKKTWTLVPRTSDMIIVQNKWVYRIKLNADGTVERLKARLVAKGFQQTPSIDFFETYSPLQEDVYMAQPQGFVDPTYPNHVCKLHKAIYGLKQAPRAWFDTLKGTLVQWGYTSSKSDNSLFFSIKNGNLLLILVYIDDILITGANKSEVQHLISALNNNFSLKNLGPVTNFLGFEVHRIADEICLTQQKYIRDLLARTQLLDSKPQSTPMCSTTKISATTGALMENPTHYRSIIGALQYLTMSRPDIAFVVNKLSQYMQAPTSEHWGAHKRILRYLASLVGSGLVFKPAHRFDIQGFTDADWARCFDDRK
uniref:Reverse transcriptase Ty1/copia-type domain-containing protein n=1 Tax=Cannabis sativa TaxID=3483 RepID=A0A803QE07_CANSA